MGINEDLKSKGAKVVRAQSYKKGIPNEKGVIIPEKLAGSVDADANKKILNDQVRAVVNLILVDREPTIQQILKDQGVKIRDNEREVLADPASLVAEELAARWQKAGIDLPDVTLWKGMCGYEQHAWFRAGMPTTLVHEPDYFYVIDPWGRGVSVISLSGQESDMVVLKPWSPFHISYAGKPICTLGLKKEGEEEPEEEGSDG